MLFKKKEALTDGEKKKRNGCLDALLELGIELLFIAIGAGVLVMLGISLDLEELDADILALVGIGVIAVVGVIAFLIDRIVKKKKPHDGDK